MTINNIIINRKTVLEFPKTCFCDNQNTLHNLCITILPKHCYRNFFLICFIGSKLLPRRVENDFWTLSKFLMDFRLIYQQKFMPDSKVNHKAVFTSITFSSIIIRYVKSKVLKLKTVNDIGERVVKLMQQFHGLLTVVKRNKSNFY